MRYFIVAVAMAFAGPAAAEDRTPAEIANSDFSTGGKLLLTGGVAQVEGAAGGGLTPWAFIGGYGTRDQIGGNAFATYVETGSYDLTAFGASVGLFDRVELSIAQQQFDTQRVGGALGLGNGFTLKQNIFGLKVKLIGDGVLEQDSLLPQISAGIQYKNNNRAALLSAIGADDDDGIDYYLSATKLFLGQSLLVNATLRYTEANQFGILGFGGDKGGYSLQAEGSVAYLLTRKLAVGAEYRTKPNNLGIAKEDDAWDVFVAYAPTKNVAITAAYVDLGNIVIRDNQRGFYLSAQFGF
jgi:hypothetical protein